MGDKARVVIVIIGPSQGLHKVLSGVTGFDVFLDRVKLTARYKE